MDDKASSTNVDHEEVISLQETATNESIVEINDNEDLKQGRYRVLSSVVRLHLDLWWNVVCKPT